MTTGGQGQQQYSASAPPKKPFKPPRKVLLVIGIFFILAFIVLGILANMKIISDCWSGISTTISGGLGIVITLLAWLLPLPADNTSSPLPPAPSPLSAAPMVHITFSSPPSPTSPFAPTISTSHAPQPPEPVPASAPAISTPQNTQSPTPSISTTSTVSAPTTVATTPQPPSPSNIPATPPAMPPDSIFQFNLPLKQPAHFYGRSLERTKLKNRILNGGATAIAGERRIGKTWLLRHTQLMAALDPELGPRFRVGYLSGSNPTAKTISGFVTQALEQLKQPGPPDTVQRPQLATLAQAIRDLARQNVVPVLCIDEFEGFDNRQEFGLDFAEGLRAMSQDDGLVLIIAGRKRLFEIVKDLTGSTSPFFNVVEQLTLKPFALKDAQTFVSDKAARATFTDDEQTFLLENAAIYDNNGNKTWPPLRLQLTGQMMLDDRAQARDSGEPEHYQPHDKTYQQDFKRRLNEQYQNVVKN